MSPRQLRALIQTGHYRMEPVLVADAMLERPGFRAFLIGGAAEARRDGHSPATESHVPRNH
jgi:hypothetical protein